MIQTVTVDIINEKALKLLDDLESLQLIRVHKEQNQDSTGFSLRLKGAMTKQSISDIENQIKDLQNDWE